MGRAMFKILLLAGLVCCIGVDTAAARCGSRGGPGIRGADGRCLSWAQVNGTPEGDTAVAPNYAPAQATVAPLLAVPRKTTPMPVPPYLLVVPTVVSEPRTQEGKLAMCDMLAAQWRMYAAERGSVQASAVEHQRKLETECRSSANSLPLSVALHAAQQ